MPVKNITVSTTDELNAALREITNSNIGDAVADTHTIEIAAGTTIDLFDKELAAINLIGGDKLVINGNGGTIDGGGVHRGLFVYHGEVSISDLTIQNTVARGGDGGERAGGGAGLGGALFIAGTNNVDGYGNALATGGHVTLSNVDFSGNAAEGGSGGGNGVAGGGGGMGGDGSANPAGAAPYGFENGGGGIGERAYGGAYILGPGNGIVPGAASGGRGSGIASNVTPDYPFAEAETFNGLPAGDTGGGGSTGFYFDHTTPDKLTLKGAGAGGGGGVGGADGSSFVGGAVGGHGGFGGGGGGAIYNGLIDLGATTGGAGGFGGGGGGAAKGAGGGWGGGGGAKAVGGFGGGSDIFAPSFVLDVTEPDWAVRFPDWTQEQIDEAHETWNNEDTQKEIQKFKASIEEAINGAQKLTYKGTGGGGGLGAGGSIFVQEGGSLTFASGGTTGGSVEGGDASVPGDPVNGRPGHGQAFGSGLYIQGSAGTANVTFAPGDGQFVAIEDVIGDDNGSALAANYAGRGGSSGITLDGANTGTLVLSAANTYSGGTIIKGGVLHLYNPATYSTAGTTLISAAAGTGAISFRADDSINGPSARLIVAASAGAGAGQSFANTLDKFGINDSLVLDGFAYVEGATATVANGVLTVTSGGLGKTFRLTDAGASVYQVHQGPGGSVLVDTVRAGIVSVTYGTDYDAGNSTDLPVSIYTGSGTSYGVAFSSTPEGRPILKLDDGLGHVQETVLGRPGGTVFESQTFSLSLDFSDNTAAVVLNGNAYGDRLRGGSASDRLDGGAGADILDGGTGNDTYFVENSGDVVREATGAGFDAVFATVDYTLAAGQEIEALVAKSTAGLTLTGNAFANRLIGGGGSDTLVGGGGGDRLIGGAGADILDGGTGNDTYFVDNAGDDVRETTGAGFDAVFATVDYTLAAGQEIEALVAKSTAGLTLTGNVFANRLIGGGGSDTLVGGGGGDRLIGGGGNDTFVFRAITDSTPARSDTIMDFTRGDHIDLTQIATGASDGNFHFLEGATKFSGQAGDLIATSKGGVVTVQGDANGDGVTDLTIKVVSNSGTLHASDFLLV